MMPSKAVFLDKDGTLVENVPYNVNPARIRLAAGASETLRSLWDAGYRLFVVSNQAGVARGFFAESELEAVRLHLHKALAEMGVKLDGFYYCPHDPDGAVEAYAVECDCRKPMPGLLLRAAREHDIDLKRSWLVGDILDDIEAAHRAGCRAILIDNGNETEWDLSTEERTPDHVAFDLVSAARFITGGATWPAGRA